MRVLLTLLIVCSSATGQTVDGILAHTGPRGLVALIDDAADLALPLAQKSELTIFVQHKIPAKVHALRQKLDDAGLLGSRVWVHRGDYQRLHLANELADAVVVIGDQKVSSSEIKRIMSGNGSGWVNSTKPIAAGSLDPEDWSHPYRRPDNNPQSNDPNVKRPFMTHYMAEPWYCPLPMQSVISGGRVFKVFGDRSSAKPQEPLINKLIAMNAFNGTMLWQRDLSPGFMIHRNTLIATPDTLFVGDDKSCQLIDPKTGKVRDEIVVPADKSDGPVWKWMALEDGVLYALVGEKEAADEPLKGDRIRGAGWPWWKIENYRFGAGKNFLAIDPKTKKILWHHREDETVDARGLAMKKGRIYFNCEGKHLGCLDARTGKILWRNNTPELLEAIGTTKGAQHPLLGFASTAYLKCSDEALFFAGPNRPYLAAASATDGKFLWKRDCSGPVKDVRWPKGGGNVHVLIRPDGLYALGEGRINEEASSLKLEPLTGKVLATFPSRDRCTRATGCVDTIFTRGGKGGSTAMFDVTSTEPRMGTMSPMRPACQDGVITAHGYLFWGPWMCRCDMTQLGVISLGPAGNFDFVAAAKDEERLETYQDAIKGFNDLSEREWTSYRRDNQRTVRTTHTTPEKVKLAWTYQPKGKSTPTAPIAVGESVYLAGSDGAVRALNKDSGDLRWTAYTGGTILYPPAYAHDSLFVGSGDGYVYRLSLEGKPLWRFRAAPQERVIPVYGQLSSTWPLGGGVIVDDKNVYGAAGISNFDGTHVFALDAHTGKIRWQQHSGSGVDEQLPAGGVSVQGPMLLHDGAVHFAAGNTPTLASYSIADGKFKGSDNGRGKDLFVRHGQVFGAGFPLYWRPEDDHFLSTMELVNDAGVLLVGIPPATPTAPNKFALYPLNKPGEQPKPLWTREIFHEVAAVAFTKNAVIVTGLNRAPKNHLEIDAAICAVSLKDGSVMWKQPLPATPTAWGLALDRTGQMIVTLIDGRVLAFKE